MLFIPNFGLILVNFLVLGIKITPIMAHSKTRTNDGKITYPPGVKEISDKISKEEMVRRLKVSRFGLCILFVYGVRS